MIKRFVAIFSILSLVLLSIFLMKIYSQENTQLYWENPREITKTESRFPIAINDDENMYVFFEEVERRQNQIWISMKSRKENELEWNETKRIAGPFEYSGEIPDIFSVALSNEGIIALSVQISTKDIGVFVSEDKGETFFEEKIPNGEKSFIGSRVFGTSDGGFLMFASLGDSNIERGKGFFSIYSSKSSDGKNWSELIPFEATKGIANPFLPYLAQVNNKDVVVFQGIASGTFTAGAIFQLFVSECNEGIWNEAKVITDDSKFRNQRPVIYSDSNKTYVAWERTETTSENAHIMIAELSDNKLVDAEELTTRGNAHRPVFFKHNEKICIVWFDDRNGTDGIYMAKKNGIFWDEENLVNTERNSSFAYPLLLGNEIAFVWEEEVSNSGRIYALEMDRSCKAPKITAQSFKEGKRSTSEKAKAKVILPEDSSGIAGFTTLWTQNIKEEPSKDIKDLLRPSQNTLTQYAPDDGIWYFKARTLDNAGNWSECATLKYHRDLTPPFQPIINEVDEDKFGFVKSNNFEITWNDDAHDDDVAGYSWNITPIGKIDKTLQVNKTHPMKLADSVVHKKVSDLILKYTKESELKKWLKKSRPPRKLMSREKKASFKNVSNGVYIFSVCSIDEVGNIGNESDYLLILNKYIPSTKILNVIQKIDENGVLSIEIRGEGFLYDGTISEVIIENSNGEKYSFKLSNGDFKVISDEKIVGIKVPDMRAGSYTVSIRHTDRGLTSWKSKLKVSESGMVKHENSYFFEPEWKIFKNAEKWFIINNETLQIILLIILSLLAISYSLAGLTKTARESVIIKNEINALIKGEKMPIEKKEIFVKKGISLRFKLFFFTTGLVIGIVMLVAISLGKRLSATQEMTLAKGLQDRVDVVMESISSGVRTYLPDGLEKSADIATLPNQTRYFAEADYATITGLPASNENTNLDYVWASNDPEIINKIDSKELYQGSSRLSEPNEQIFGLVENLNKEAVAQVSEISEKIALLRVEMENATAERMQEISESTTEYYREIESKLNDLSVDAASSIPHFSTEKLDRSQTVYTFYKPVLYRQSGDNETFVRSIVMMKVSTINLINAVDKARREVFLISSIIAVIAIILGAIAANFFVSLIIKPIQKLVLHVHKIGETKDKEELEGEEIQIKSHDEIRTLGDAINEMTEGLVQGAKDEKEAKRLQEENIKHQEETIKAQKELAVQQEETIKAQKETQALQEQMLKAQEAALKDKLMNSDGRLIQTCYVPLNDGKDGRTKDTIATFKDKNVDLYCYYEGSDDLSGDYFGYKKLDDGYYAVMKCDVSGHGTPASLITSVLAVSFNNYFGNWSFKKNGTRLNELAVNLNDSIGQLNLKGKFATLLIALFDSKNDCVYLCHAGDNIVRFYDSTTKSQKTLKLKEAGAAGAIKRDLYEMMGMDISTAYNVIKYPLKKNDILFLYTDGIEESQSKFKDKNFNNILKGKDSNEFEYEEFSNDRIKDVVETYFKKGKYVLKREHPQNPNEHLEFDFSSCSGEIDDMILALSSIEKVFRFYKKNDAKGDVEKDAIGNGVIHGSAVRVDRRIDEFLKRTFNMYDYYCSNQKDIGVQNYIYYLNIDEDKQEDDLTIYAIKNIK